MTDDLTVGDVCHYRAYGTPGGEHPAACRAATITELGCWITTDTITDADGQSRGLIQQWSPWAVGLAVQNPTGLFFNAPVLMDRGDAGQPPNGGTWHQIGDCRNWPRP